MDGFLTFRSLVAPSPRSYLGSGEGEGDGEQEREERDRAWKQKWEAQYRGEEGDTESLTWRYAE